jgi:hypothetical protein
MSLIADAELVLASGWNGRNLISFLDGVLREGAAEVLTAMAVAL